jgi:hypothetical protein
LVTQVRYVVDSNIEQRLNPKKRLGIRLNDISKGQRDAGQNGKHVDEVAASLHWRSAQEKYPFAKKSCSI